MNFVKARFDASSIPALTAGASPSPSIAFAVTDGPTHVLRYTNSNFRRLQAAGEIGIGPRPDGTTPTADLTSMLDRAYLGPTMIRERLASPAGDTGTKWDCAIWPVSPDVPPPEGLVIEIRDAAYLETGVARQRAITERLLIAAMREQDAARREQEIARDAISAGGRSAYQAAASRDLAESLEEHATREVVARLGFLRAGTWGIVDVAAAAGGTVRLAVVHPDPAQQEQAQALAACWSADDNDPIRAASVVRSKVTSPFIVEHDVAAARLTAVPGSCGDAQECRMPFGDLLVVPLVVRTKIIGTMTFVSPSLAAPFSREEIALAADLAERCAIALDHSRLYREADTLRERADGANRAKSAFLGNMSHELMTPLNAIGGYAELLEMGLRGPVNAEQRIDLVRIKKNQEHLLGLIREILTYVHAESGRTEYNFAKVSIQSVMTEVSEMLNGLANKRGLILSTKGCHADASVWADRERVRQILVNLVMNAVKYTPQNGGAISLGCTAMREMVIVQVADHGLGIPHEKLEDIFTPFVQLKNGLTDRVGGVGLGLSISRDLARAMHGDLTVESTEGAGSRLTLSLRKARDENANNS
jgi:signal transduction histidine kinase